MRIAICAVGRMRRGPEQAMTDDYLARFARTGRSVGLGPATVLEVDERKAQGMAAQGTALERMVPDGALTVCLDERGRTLTSPEFAKRLGLWADGGRADLCFLIGGADGLDKSLRSDADLSLSLGQMVWPHMMVRVMLAEQLYRAATILTGGPYHRA